MVKVNPVEEIIPEELLHGKEAVVIKEDIEL
jgi:hypothetical protein